MYEENGNEYATGDVKVPEGLIRWDAEFLVLIKNNLPASVKRGAIIIIEDEEDNTVYFKQYFNPNKTK
jgi:hypothetical protein